MIGTARLVLGELIPWMQTEPMIRRNRPFTKLQGQYLAFIRLYAELHGRPPAEADMQAYFKVTPPSVHRMVMALAARGCIARVPGQSRSIKILVPRDELPGLDAR